MDELIIIICIASILICPLTLGSMRFLKETRTKKAGYDISVIIVTRNDESRMKKHVSAVYQSMGEETQIVVVDRGSGDGTADTAEGFGCDVVRVSKNTSANAARFIGSKRAVYPLLLFIDGNLLITGDLVMRMVQCYTRSAVLSAAPHTVCASPKNGLSGFYMLLRRMTLHAFNPRTSKHRGLFEECMIIGRTDYISTCSHDAVPVGADTGIFMASAYTQAKMRVRNYYGGAYAVKQDELMPGSPIIPVSAAGGLCVIILLAGAFVIPVKLFMNFANFNMFIFWGWMYVMYGSVIITFLKKGGDYSIFWGVLFPFQAFWAMVLMVVNWGRMLKIKTSAPKNPKTPQASKEPV